MIHGFTLVFLAFTGWFLLLYVLERRGLLQRLGLSLMGPFLMWKTTKGRDLIERLAQWRRWDVVGRAFVALVAVTMAAMTLLLIWSATLVSRIPAEQAPSPQVLLGLPGINPFIPLSYGIFALAVSIVVHEFAHGILARRWKVGIRSLGILLFIVPIGAFVEPEEEEMQALDRRQRGAIYAAGPGINVVLALVLAAVFSLGMMGAVQAKAAGVGITAITPDSPAEAAGLDAGMIITHLDGVRVETPSEFHERLQETVAGQTIALRVLADGTGRTVELTLADRYDFTGEEEDRGVGFVGVVPATTNPDVFNPLVSSQRIGWGTALFLFTFLPFQGLMPVQAPLTDFYAVTGAWAAVPVPLFWILANTVYWLFWINLMLGMTNALPAVPLDGGYLFRDWLSAGIARLRRGMGMQERERAARNLSYLVALFILALILWQLIGPRI